MKKLIQNVPLVVTSTTIIVGGFLFFTNFHKRAPKHNLIKTQKPQRRSLCHTVHAQGTLEAQGHAKVGSLITGTVKKILAGEGQKVKRDELLAILDNGKGGDTTVRQQEALLEKAKANLRYQESYFKRQQSLFNAGQLSKDAYEKSLQDYTVIKAEVKNQQAAYEKEKFVYDSSFIRSPCDGTILAVVVKEGETVSEFAPPSVLFEIVQNLETMTANLTIDENKIGFVEQGQKVKISVDTYPYRKWVGTIQYIANAPTKQTGSPTNASQSPNVRYSAECIVPNQDKALKPGMTIHAKIIVAKKTNTLALPGFVFQINTTLLEKIAPQMGYRFTPLGKNKKRDLYNKKPDKTIPQTLWILTNNTVTEKVVYTGITNNAYFEIASGLGETDDVIFDISGTDEMKKWYKEWVGGGL